MLSKRQGRRELPGHTAAVFVSLATLLLASTDLRALGTAPGDVAGYIIGLEAAVEVYQDDHSEDGRLLGKSWRPARVGQPVYIEDSVMAEIAFPHEHWQPYRYGRAPMPGTHAFTRGAG